MTYFSDVQRVRADWRKRKVIAWLDAVSEIAVGLAALWLIAILGIAAMNGRLW